MISKRKIQDFALYLFAFSLNFEYWKAFGLSNFLSLGALTGYIYFSTLLLNPKFQVNHKDLKAQVLPLFLFFLILTTMSFVNYKGAESGGWFNISVFQCTVLYIALYLHLSNREINVALNTLNSFAAGSILLTVLYNFGIGISYSNGMRLSVLGIGSNGLGFIMAVSIVIILSNVFENRLCIGRIRYLFLFFIPFMLKLLAETGSRGSFFSLVIALVVFIIFIRMKRSSKLLFFTLAVFVFIFMIQFMLRSEILKDRILMTIEKGDTSSRTEIWDKTIPLFLENPVFGVGETGYYNFASRVFSFYKVPHNVFIEILIYTGIVGFLCYTLMLFRISGKAFISYKYYGFLLPGTLLIMICITFLTGQGLFVKLVWLLFAINFGLAPSPIHSEPVNE